MSKDVDQDHLDRINEELDKEISKGKSLKAEVGDRETLDAKVDKAGREIAHMHQPDRRANQSGPILSPDMTFGRQTKEPCYSTIYNVRNPGGYMINERVYRGRVKVAQCIADYLTGMDREWERAERSIFNNNPVERHMGNFSG